MQTLQKPTTNAVLVEDGLECDFHAMVFAIMAKEHSRGAKRPPIANWMDEEPTPSIRIGSDRYIVSRGRHPDDRSIGGLTLTIKRNDYGGADRSQESYFIPYSAVESLHTVLKGAIRL